MTPEEAKKQLAQAEHFDEPVILPLAILDNLSLDDVPENVSIEIGTLDKQVIHLEWEGCLYRKGKDLVVEAELIYTRKYWYIPLNLEHYLDLVRRAIELRQHQHGDVSLVHYDDDGAFIQMSYIIHTGEKNLRKAYQQAKSLRQQLEEAADDAANEVGQKVVDLAGRISGWGSQSLDTLLDVVEKASTYDERGRSLEELVCQLLETIPGFSVTDRIRTATEEIDVSVLNDSDDPRFRRESAILLTECKNWSGKCGKNEFVLFKEKIENRSSRCSLGFLVSWNGFKNTITKEMLRGSREQTLVIPITGKEIRAAVRDNNFADIVGACWDKAINI